MNSLKKHNNNLLIVTLFIASLFSSSVWSASLLSTMKVENNILYFTLENNQVSSTGCVAAENTGIWATSLNTNAGQGIYLALNTAMASGKKINIKSASDCFDAQGFERPSSVVVVLQ
ncbi:MAG: hypothetical protein ACI9LM_000789 [Alteromonadaceae bacterium]|jgi:hypothetical protein